ncbi:MAG: serine/threonine-protein phosphatase, partial [Leptospiraceae bacterium]|nr:serine/threonine-protein phosphatase [Leptospiraceae bacterium]
HPALLVWKRRNAQLLKIRPLGRLLGIFQEVHFDVEELALESGDRLIVYTDGVFEAANEEGEHFGESRLGDLVIKNSDLPAEEFADELQQNIVTWSGGEQNLKDDIAFIVVDME